MKILLLEFDEKASLVHSDQLSAITSALAQGDYSDLIVVSHGWNNNDDEAKALYDNLLNLVSQELPNDKKFIAIGVIWPSKRFGDVQSSVNAASAGPSSSSLVAQIDALAKISESDQAAQHLSVLSKQISDKFPAKNISETFSDLFTTLDPDGSSSRNLNEENIPQFQPADILNMLSDPELWIDGSSGNGIGGIVATSGTGGSASLFSQIGEGLQNLLNLTTYYMMKSRSGLIGSQGLNPVLRTLRKDFPELKIRIVGHSFGARLVSSAIIGGSTADQVEVDSLALLQAAFSHYAFAQSYHRSLDGLYRAIVDKKLIKGCFFITHSRLDKAVGLAYAVASRMANQVGAKLGGKDDFYGGLGGNGAQSTPESKQIDLLDVHQAYAFENDIVYNLKSDQFIMGHSDICNRQVAHALVAGFKLQ